MENVDGTGRSIHDDHDPFAEDTDSVLLQHHGQHDKYTHTRCIIHIDLDCFYAQVEMIRNPTLRSYPVGVQQKYLVVTCNYVARKLGVKKLMSIKEAKRVCPDLVLVNGEDLSHYRDCSQKVFRFFEQYSNKVEKLGLDENFLDVTSHIDELIKRDDSSLGEDDSIIGHALHTEQENVSLKEVRSKMKSQGIEPCKCGCHLRLLHGTRLAGEIREQLCKELSLTSCAGVAHNKILAKLAGELHKPNQQTVIFPDYGLSFLRSCKISKIPGVGYKYSKSLSALGVHKVEHLDCIPTVSLFKQFGKKMTEFLINISHGIDNATVEKSGDAKSMSEEETFRTLADVDEASSQLRILIDKLFWRLKARTDLPGTIRLTVRKRTEDGRSLSRESKQVPFCSEIMSMKDAKERENVVFNMAFDLLKKLVDIEKPFDLSLMNLCFTNFKNLATAAKVNSVASYFAQHSAQKSRNPDSSILMDPIHKESNFNNTTELGSTNMESSKTWQEQETHLFYDNGIVNFRDPEDSNEMCREVWAWNGDITQVATEISQECVNTNCKPSTSSVLDGKNIPNEIDRDVLNALPEDIRNEYLLYWNSNESYGVKEGASPNISLPSQSLKRKRVESPAKAGKTKRENSRHDRGQRNISEFFSKQRDSHK